MHAVGEKERIARAALDELPDGGSIILDAGTTTVRLAELLPTRSRAHRRHALDPGRAASWSPVRTSRCTCSAASSAAARSPPWGSGRAPRSPRSSPTSRSWAPTASASSADSRRPTSPRRSVKKALIDAARRTVVLADHTKFGREDFARVAPLSAIDTVITDSGLDPELAEDMENAGPRVVVV